MNDGALLALALAWGLFTAVHAVVLSLVEPYWPRAFQISRGLAAVALTALGLAALVDAFPEWPRAFLYRNAPDDWMRQGVAVVLGHLLADFLWMFQGARFHGIRPRRDLIIHHGLGVIGFGASLVLGIGHALALLTMITEILPITTGLNAWARRTGNETLQRRADRLRLHSLAWGRIPLWVFLEVVVLQALIRGEDPGLSLGRWIAAAGLLALLVLDFYWLGKCRQRVDFY